MSRLPDLERVLLDAAARLDGAPAGSARRRRWRRRGTPLPAVIASLAIAGGAVAAATGLLDSGDPVPPSPERPVVKPVPAPAAGVVRIRFRVSVHALLDVIGARPAVACAAQA